MQAAISIHSVRSEIEELNKENAEKVLDLPGGNRSKAAEVLGISRTCLWRILKEE